MARSLVLVVVVPRSRPDDITSAHCSRVVSIRRLVFDTGNIPSSTRRQIDEIRKLTSKPVRFIVNSHWHPDHHLGNAEYGAAFPGVAIIGTSATRDGILTRRMPNYFNQIRGFATTDSLMRLRLSTGKMRDGSTMTEDVRTMWTIDTRDCAEFKPEVLSTHSVGSDLVFDDSITVTLGSRVIKIVRAGRGNTAGDTFVYVPDANVLLTGDLVTQPCPFPGTAFFGEWIADLDRLKSYHAATIVPGHGDPMSNYGYVDLTKELLQYTLDNARSPFTRRKLSMISRRRSISHRLRSASDAATSFGATVSTASTSSPAPSARTTRQSSRNSSPFRPSDEPPPCEHA